MFDVGMINGLLDSGTKNKNKVPDYKDDYKEVQKENFCEEIAPSENVDLELKNKEVTEVSSETDASAQIEKVQTSSGEKEETKIVKNIPSKKPNRIKTKKFLFKRK